MTNNPEFDVRKRLKDDFTFYAQNCLKIRTKEGKILPFALNKAQKYIDNKIRVQIAKTGKVRVLLLKGRQQGASTYVEGRFYWKTTHNLGVRAFILTHEQAATDNLFKLATRYHQYCPPEVKPNTTNSNAKELNFGGIDSGYAVGTAGTKGVGRSSTIQYFHGSEVAFWPNADTHAVGVMQAIPDADGTEVILESTANGLGNFFHEQWKKAESGESEYIAVFVPWFWQDEYTIKLDSNEVFELSDDEQELKEHYGLSNEQLKWRRNKIIVLSAGGVNGETQFKQEYPMSAAEAFQMTGVDTLITAPVVMRARKHEVKEPQGAKIVGVDPSLGGDRFAIIKRQGRKMYGVETYVRDEVDTLEKRAAKCVRVLEDEKPDMMFIDAGFGADLVDYLRDMLGYENVKAIHFASTPTDTRKYKHKRSEMAGNFADWLNDENAPVDVPDTDEFQADVCACPYKTNLDNQVMLVPKKEIKKIIGFSPDIFDAAILTFAERVEVASATKKVNLDRSSRNWRTM